MTVNRAIAAKLLKIAQDELGIDTLETRCSDRLDFHQAAVWCVKDALAAAFQAGVDHATRGTSTPRLAIVSVRHGLVEEVRANHPLHVLIEDWDGTEVRPSHAPMVPERMLPGEEAQLIHFFQPATDQGE